MAPENSTSSAASAVGRRSKRLQQRDDEPDEAPTVRKPSTRQPKAVLSSRTDTHYFFAGKDKEGGNFSQFALTPFQIPPDPMHPGTGLWYHTAEMWMMTEKARLFGDSVRCPCTRDNGAILTVSSMPSSACLEPRTPRRTENRAVASKASTQSHGTRVSSRAGVVVHVFSFHSALMRNREA